MMLNKLIDFNTFKVYWEEVYKLEEFNKLKKTPIKKQFYKHFFEFVDEHTHHIINQLYKLDEWNELTNQEKLILVTSALFQNIGKGKVTKLNEDGSYTCKNYSLCSDRLTRYILWNEDFDIRENVCSLIKYHLNPFTIYSELNLQKEVIKISTNKCNIKLLLLLSKCNVLSTDTSILQNMYGIGNFMTKALLLNCYTKPFKFFSDNHKFHYFNDYDNNISPFEDNNLPKNEFDVYLVCGVCGSGKDTYINNNLHHLPMISRDNIRINHFQLKEKCEGTKEQENEISDIVTKNIIKYCKTKTSFILNQMFIYKWQRNKTISLLLPYNPKIHIIYIETSLENSIQRRTGQINKDKITKLQKELHFPEPYESHTISYLKN